MLLQDQLPTWSKYRSKCLCFWMQSELQIILSSQQFEGEVELKYDCTLYCKNECNFKIL